MISYLNLFQKIFPHEKIITVQHAEGFEHSILDINNRWICKVPKDRHSSRLDTEAKLLQLLPGKLNTPIPAVEYYEPHFLVYKKIPGVELTQEIYEKLDQIQKDALAYDIAFFLYELHHALSSKEARQLGLTQTDWPWPPEKLLQHAKLIKDLQLQEIFQKFIQEYKHYFRENSAVLIHNDMILRNIIINKQTGQLSGIIDFTDAAFDDPYFDLRLNHTSIPKLSETIAKKYASIAHIPLTLAKIYSYYMATEFSRYIQYAQEQKIEERSMLKKRIMQCLSAPTF